MLIGCIEQTLAIAKARAVDSDLLGAHALLAPCIYLAANVADDAVASPIGSMRVDELQVAPPE
jgi:hypothetical protein